MDPVEIVAGVRMALRADHLDEALVLLDALRELPSPRLWMLRADVHRERNEPELAWQALERARQLGAPDAVRVRQALLWRPILPGPVALDREASERGARLADLDGGAALRIDDPVAELPWLDFYLAYRGLDDRTLREALGRVLRRASPGLRFVAPHVSDPRDPAAPVRLGLCSAHLKDHTIGRLNRALVEGLGARGYQVVLALVDPPTEPFGRALCAAADEVIVTGRDLAVAQRRLTEARLDVLHYPDLGMDPFTTWLAFSRLAPVQTVSWGHPITSGLPTIDAFLASDFLVPHAAEHQFTEAVVRLPDPMVCWSPPDAPTPLTRAHFGLPADRPVYLIPQSAFKLHPAFDAVLRDIVEADTDGVIALLAPKRSGWKQAIEQRLGLPAGRLAWVPRQPRERYLALLQTAEVLLDPFPFGGGHTSLEALAMGTPIVTRATDQLRGRLTACWYDVMGLSDLVASDARDYVSKAVAWATDDTRRTEVERSIAARRDRLFDQTAAVDAHAEVFRALLADCRPLARAV